MWRRLSGPSVAVADEVRPTTVGWGVVAGVGAGADGDDERRPDELEELEELDEPEEVGGSGGSEGQFRDAKVTLEAAPEPWALRARTPILPETPVSQYGRASAVVDALEPERSVQSGVHQSTPESRKRNS